MSFSFPKGYKKFFVGPKITHLNWSSRESNNLLNLKQKTIQFGFLCQPYCYIKVQINMENLNFIYFLFAKLVVSVRRISVL